MYTRFKLEVKHARWTNTYYELSKPSEDTSILSLEKYENADYSGEITFYRFSESNLYLTLLKGKIQSLDEEKHRGVYYYRTRTSSLYIPN